MDIHNFTPDSDETWLITYHFVWVPMRFKPCLTGEIAARLRALIEEGAGEAEYAPLTVVIEPDRVYLAASAPPTRSPHQIVCQVKARTSRALRDEFPELTRIPTLWTRAYLVMAGDQLTAEEVLRRFEAAQPPRRPRGRPRKTLPASPEAETEA
jgi:REP-associated tyrosine transposase